MITITITKRQRKNLIEAKRMWLTVPEKNVVRGLSLWRSLYDKNRHLAPDCKTIACFGGWCAWWPAFRKQGIIASRTGGPVFAFGKKSKGVSEVLFGGESLFSSRMNHSVDDELTEEDSDWRIVMNRIDWFIENSVVTKG